MSEQEKLMKMLTEYQFAINEVNLFLDTHPENKKALSEMSNFVEKYNELKTKYESKYGMLTVFSPNKGDTWQWVKSPWPWEN